MPKTRADERTEALKRTIGRHLKAAMAKKDVLGRELALQVGVEPGSVSDWRVGRSLLTIENLLEVAKALDEPVSFLVGDAFHGIDSIEALGRQLAVRLGQRRLSALTHLPDTTILAAIDHALGQHIAEVGPIPGHSARRQPTRQKRRK